MKTKLLLASMILLASLSASAQKIYTGIITFEKGSTVYDIENVDALDKAETEKGKDYLTNVVKAAYGRNPYYYHTENSNAARNLDAIFIQTLTEAKKNPFIKGLPSDKGSIVIYGQLSGSKYGGTAIVTDIYIIDTKKNTVYSFDTKQVKKIKA